MHFIFRLHESVRVLNYKNYSENPLTYNHKQPGAIRSLLLLGRVPYLQILQSGEDPQLG